MVDNEVTILRDALDIADLVFAEIERQIAAGQVPIICTVKHSRSYNAMGEMDYPYLGYVYVCRLIGCGDYTANYIVERHRNDKARKE